MIATRAVMPAIDSSRPCPHRRGLLAERPGPGTLDAPRGRHLRRRHRPPRRRGRVHPAPERHAPGVGRARRRRRQARALREADRPVAGRGSPDDRGGRRRRSPAGRGVDDAVRRPLERSDGDGALGCARRRDRHRCVVHVHDRPGGRRQLPLARRPGRRRTARRRHLLRRADRRAVGCDARPRGGRPRSGTPAVWMPAPKRHSNGSTAARPASAARSSMPRNSGSRSSASRPRWCSPAMRTRAASERRRS